MKNNINVLFSGISLRSLKVLAVKVMTSLMKKEKASFSELNIMFCGDKEIKELNRKFRKKNKPTDIITFCYEEGKRKGMAGDIAISVQTAKRQAKERGHSLKKELTVLFVHGFYHLMGEDHIKEKDYLRMKKVEEKAIVWLKKTLKS